jgi:dTMP kinase
MLGFAPARWPPCHAPFSRERTVPGVLVAFEGIDQAGKMTQAHALHARLRASGLSGVVRGCPDYDTAIGKVIRDFLSHGLTLDVHARCMLFAANRWEKDAEMRQLRAAHDLVCIDRYTWSNVVYGMSQGLEESWLRALEAGLLEADVTVLLDISPEESARRKSSERDDYERNTSLLVEARRNYRRIADERDWIIVDAEGAGEVVTARLHAALAARLTASFPAVARALR